MTQLHRAFAPRHLDRYTTIDGYTRPHHADQRSQQQENGLYVNQFELRVIGMSRSGNHAIIHWLLNQAPGRSCFLNCVEGKTNPFVSARPLHRDGLPYAVNYPEFSWDRELRGNFSQKDLLIHSYEDNFLGYVCHPLFEQHHDQWVGPSRRRYDVLILRDPFNLFASRLRAGFSHLSLRTTARIWQQHAREFLGQRHHLNQPRILINYNRWATERSYRQQLAEQLGLPFTDVGIHTVHKTAGGSSFDGLRYNGEAGQMKVLERWKAYQADPTYRQLFDPTLVDLSQRIFGSLPGTAAWLAEQQHPVVVHPPAIEPDEAQPGVSHGL